MVRKKTKSNFLRLNCYQNKKAYLLLEAVLSLFVLGVMITCYMTLNSHYSISTDSIKNLSEEREMIQQDLSGLLAGDLMWGSGTSVGTNGETIEQSISDTLYNTEINHVVIRIGDRPYSFVLEKAKP